MPEFVRDLHRIALGVKQPWAELLLQGQKTLEIRSSPTQIRGPIYLYTSRKIAQEDFAQLALQKTGCSRENLPCGLLVGSIPLTDCRPAQPADATAACVPAALLKNVCVWARQQPERFLTPQPVRFLPYGVWFYTFQRQQKDSSPS